MALFFAIFPDDPSLRELAEFQRRLSEEFDDSEIRWEPSSKFHLTLKYLGREDSSGRIEELASLAAERVQVEFAPFDVSLLGAGAFPDEKNPEVLWIGVKNGFPVLVHLAESLDRSLKLEGFESEVREYRPHLTLAKVKGRTAIASLSKYFKNRSDSPEIVDKICCYRVSSFSLVRSEQTSEGSSYTLLKEFQFAR